MKSSTAQIRTILILYSCVYLCSWLLPALNFENGEYIWPGWACFLNGIFFGIFELHFEAFANLFIIPAVILVWKEKWPVALTFSCIALILASQTFVLNFMYLNEAGAKAYFSKFELGFYLWYAFFVALFGLSICGLFLAKFVKTASQTVTHKYNENE